MTSELQNAPKKQRRRHSENPSSRRSFLESPFCHLPPPSFPSNYDKPWETPSIKPFNQLRIAAVHLHVSGRLLLQMTAPPFPWHTHRTSVPKKMAACGVCSASHWGHPLLIGSSPQLSGPISCDIATLWLRYLRTVRRLSTKRVRYPLVLWFTQTYRILYDVMWYLRATLKTFQGATGPSQPGFGAGVRNGSGPNC